MPDGTQATQWEAALPAERAKLVRFCAYLTGSAEAAEDLAQETLYLAWRLRARHRDGEPRAPWLAAIARNVCLRWKRERGRETVRRVPTPAELEPADRCDIEAELERSELVDLLDRAMAQLPEDTRRLLVERFVRESHHAEIAGRLGLSEGAVIMRLQRGKLQLRRILTTVFREEAAAFGLADTAAPEWEQTRIWCPECGARRLWGRWTPGRQLWLECWGCRGHPRAIITHGWAGEFYWGKTCGELLTGVSGFKPAANRLAAATYEVYKHGTAGLTARCCWCLRRVPVYVSPLGDVRTYCRHCGGDNGFSASGAVAFCHPAAQAFWRRHGRIRSLRDRHVETAGLPAVVYGIESVHDRSTLEVILARDTLVPLGAHGAPRG